MIHFHRWSKWQAVEDSPLFVRKLEASGYVRYPIGQRLVQERTCEKCGKCQRRKQDIY